MADFPDSGSVESNSILRRMENPDQIPYDIGLTVRDETEVSSAIRECAQICLDHPSVRDCVQAFGARLLAQGWVESDVQQVMLGTLHVVAYLKDDDSLIPPRA